MKKQKRLNRRTIKSEIEADHLEIETEMGDEHP